ncbi:MAG: hypothetical protein MUE85_04820 [Microscillaceae bacterium]|jgi:hypothetical protein|nr:hypothetical protein [Microscillaceae bacterium]
MKTLQIILALGLLMALSACKKQIEIQEVVKEVEKKKSWQEHQGVYYYYKVCKNIISDGEKIFVHTANSVYSVDSSKMLGSYEPVTPLPEQKPFLNKNFFLKYRDYNDEKSLGVVDTKFYANIIFKMTNFDPDFSQFYPLGNENKVLTSANDQHFLLLPYIKNVQSGSNDYFQKILLIKLNLDNGAKIDNFKIIPFPNDGEVYGWMRVEDFFIISIGGLIGSNAGTFKITSDGTIKKVSPQLFARAIKYKDKILAINDGGDIYQSNLSGENWQKLAGMSYTLSLMNYIVIQDDLYGYFQDKIYYFDFGKDKLTLKPLKNDGLERNFITGMATLHDKVYVATLSGLFYKPISALKQFTN